MALQQQYEAGVAGEGPADYEMLAAWMLKCLVGYSEDDHATDIEGRRDKTEHDEDLWR